MSIAADAEECPVAGENAVGDAARNAAMSACLPGVLPAAAEKPVPAATGQVTCCT